MITNTQRILSHLKKVGESTPSSIRDKTKVHYQVVKLLLADLEEKKIVKKRTNENGTFEYWSLE